MMTRVTRSRRAVSASEEADAKTNAKRNVVGKVTKAKSIKRKVNTKDIVEQDENAVPITRNSKSTNVKSSEQKSGVLKSKVQSKKDAAVQKSEVFTLKSPALRDRTNTSVEMVKKDSITKKLDENKSKKKTEVKKSVVKKTVDKSDHELDDAQINLVKCTAPTKSNLRNTRNKAIKQATKPLPAIADSNRKSKEKKPLSEKVLKSPVTAENNRASKKMNMSVDDVEKLLNEDDEDSENEVVDSNEEEEEHEDEVQKIREYKNVPSCDEANAIEEQQAENEPRIKKFFKYKSVERELKPTAPVIPNKKNVRRPINSRKKVAKKVHNDSTFSPKVDEQRKSTKPEEKKLRPRAVKNYNEESKRVSSTPEQKTENVQNPTGEKDHKGVPIYNTVGLSQDKKDNDEEIYAFPDDSQEMEPKGKKRKKTVKRATAPKRARKAVPAVPRKIQKKPTKNIPRTVQFKDDIGNSKLEKNKETAIEKTNSVEKNATKSIPVLDEIPEIGESTFEEASTIKIVSNQKLEGSSKINLMATPIMPRTVTSDLKLFGPKNPITSKPTTQYNNMVNHSLIRKSMSPINKIVEEFDAGSPWRAVDAFSRIQRVVQSTPQVKRLPPARERRVPITEKKSICSEDTIHNSAIDNEQQISDVTPNILTSTQKNQLSPRKFGTVVSNLSPVQSSMGQKSPDQATSLQASLPEINQKSPREATSPQHVSPGIPANNEDMSTIHLSQNQNIESPYKSPVKKVNAPSPFRFEKIRSSKRLSTAASPKPQPAASESISKEIEPEASTSKQDKPKTVLKQTNLNNFLNLDDMPESTSITTAHGIFDDVHSTPVNAKKRARKLSEDMNIHNAFGFDDGDTSVSPVKESPPISKIATEEDVKNSKKGKLFAKARVKSALPSRISENTVKRTLLNRVVKKNHEDKVVPKIFDIEEDNLDKENEKSNANNNAEEAEFLDPKKAVIEAVTFSDTFDVLSETGEIESKVPEDLPLFVDLQPEKFTQPPRRSYCKRKRAAHFDNSMEDLSDSDEEHEKKKVKKKKESKLTREDRKRMEEWVENINKTFDEIEHFDLLVE